jgi:hypothetical protein
MGGSGKTLDSLLALMTLGMAKLVNSNFVLPLKVYFY